MTNVALGSDAFFPFEDNIERAAKSGVKYIAQPGGSVRDEAVIECCDSFGMAMAMTGIRLSTIDTTNAKLHPCKSCNKACRGVFYKYEQKL